MKITLYNQNDNHSEYGSADFGHICMFGVRMEPTLYFSSMDQQTKLMKMCVDAHVKFRVDGHQVTIQYEANQRAHFRIDNTDPKPNPVPRPRIKKDEFELDDFVKTVSSDFIKYKVIAVHIGKDEYDLKNVSEETVGYGESHENVPGKILTRW